MERCTHNRRGNEEILRQAGLADGWHIRFVTQPAQSPDLNILDLGFFAALKARCNKLKVRARNIDELLDKVRIAYQNYPSDALDKIWAHLFDCYNEILKINGCNQYKPPHRGATIRVRGAPTQVDLSINMHEFNRVLAIYP